MGDFVVNNAMYPCKLSNHRPASIPLIICENAAASAGSVCAMLWYAVAIAIISVYMYIHLVGDQGGPCICIQA